MIIRENIIFYVNGKYISLVDLLETYIKKYNYFNDNNDDNDNELAKLRLRRQLECFSIVDRGTLWYNSLSTEQYTELANWRQAWLDVTDTKVVPVAPSWINDKLEGEQIL